METQYGSVKKSHKGLKIFLIIVAIILIILLILFSIYQSKLGKMQIEECSNTNKVIENYQIPGMVSDSNLLPTGDINKKDNIFNVLLIGTDDRKKDFSDKANLDMAILLSVNEDTKAIKAIHFNRGIGLKPGDRNKDWLNTVYNDGGTSLLMDTMRKYLKVDVKKYIRINANTLINLVDNLDGMYINLTDKDINRLKLITNKANGLAEGVNHVDGEMTLYYTMIDEVEAKLTRQQRQQKVMQAKLDSIKGLSAKEIYQLSDKILPLVKTNLKKSEMTSLILNIAQAGSSNLRRMSIPRKGTYSYNENSDNENVYQIDFKTNSDELAIFIYSD